MKSSYPKIHWEAVPMPVGPRGDHGTLTFTNAWGIPSASAGEHNTAAAISFVKYLTTVKQQVKFADAFGVLPSRISAAKQYANKTPSIRAFVKGAAYAVPQVNTIGWPTVQQSFDNQVNNLATLNPKTLLDQLQTNAEALGTP
jgi:multiple sugar transport system substrate-binding protein